MCLARRRLRAFGSGGFTATAWSHVEAQSELNENFRPLDRYWREDPQPVSFQMVLPALDRRAFTSGSGTVALHQKDWQSAMQLD